MVGELKNDASVGENAGGDGGEVLVGDDWEKEVENLESGVATETTGVTEGTGGTGVGKKVGVMLGDRRLPDDEGFSDFPIWKNWKLPRPSSILC